MKKKRKKEWFDNKAFWKAFYPFLFHQERFANTPEQIKKILALTKPRGKAVLDLCCGPGRCSIVLAKARFRVTGVDKTKFLLDKARARARKAKAKIEWVQADMRDFVRPQAFDLILSLFTSFGYFDDKEEDVKVLRNIHASLKPGGACIIEMMGKEVLAKAFHPIGSDDLPDGTTLIQRRRIYDDWTRIRNEWIILRKGRARSFKFHHTIYSGQELKDRLMRAGFSKVKLYGNLEGDEYNRKAQRLIAVGRK